MLQITAESKLTKKQVKHSLVRTYNEAGYTHRYYTIQAEIRYDDECGNGHNSFAVTAEVRARNGKVVACGCMHEAIAKYIPEFAPFIKWHLCSSDGPMYYIANTLYAAGDRDCYGKRAGEPNRWSHAIQFGENPIKHRLRTSFIKFLQANRAGVGGEFDFEVIRYDHDGGEKERKLYGPKYTFGGYGEKWHECPFDTEEDALDFLTALQMHTPRFLEIATGWSDGKSHEFDAARNAACWPEATEEELTAPDLKERLEARLPGLLVEMRQAVESLGFVW